jgi:polyphosphate kinase 2 (PPK2 family)
MADPAKRWKFDPNDFEERKHWREYEKAYEDAFRATGTQASPWFIVPANHRWFRDFLTLKIVVSALEHLHLSYPKVEIPNLTQKDEK